MDYYNEVDPFMCQWLEELMAAKQIPKGKIDGRSIEDVLPNDLRGFTQCHFFAGLGGWPLALKIAKWPKHKPVWTGSTPCQPFSNAGEGKGFDDERHLFPAFHYLIDKCRPTTVLGEQVSGKIAYPWLQHVQASMGASGYMFGSIGLPAASAWAPHPRERLWWVGHTNGTRRSVYEKRQQPKPRAAKEKQSRYYNPVISPWVHISPGSLPSMPVDGLPMPVGIIRGFGNAIVPQVAAEFVELCRQVLKI
jgi:DNA (cytosine-5)-methyltransferase 1